MQYLAYLYISFKNWARGAVRGSNFDRQRGACTCVLERPLIILIVFHHLSGSLSFYHIYTGLAAVMARRRRKRDSQSREEVKSSSSLRFFDYLMPLLVK